MVVADGETPGSVLLDPAEVLGDALAERLGAIRLIRSYGATDLEGDRLFPPWNRDEFELLSAQPARTAGGVDFRFARYQRRRAVTR